ncbi:MAG: hypothetical protein PUD25_00290 [Bacilli bacterium]|nr:hypothetical protein [Bacilli bacterium]
MKYTSIFEKLFSLISIINTSWINLIFLGIIILATFLFLKKKISKKACFILSTISTILLISYIIFNNGKVLGNVFDSIMDDLFTNIYFPSTYAYLFVYFFMNISILGSLINIKHKSTYKTIHGVFFIIINFLFALVLEFIANNKIDIFKKTSLFSNKNLIILLELSIMVFVFWLLSLGLVYLSTVISDRILLKQEKKKLQKEDQTENQNTLEATISIPEEVGEKNTSTVPAMNTSLIENKENLNTDTTPSYHFIPTMPNHSMNQQMINENLIKQEEPITNTIPPFMTSYPTHEFATPVNNKSDIQENSFDLSSFIPKKQERQIVTPVSNSNTVLNQILNNSLPYIQEDPEQIKLENEKNTYTLNDYRIFNKMLKDIKEHNQNNSITIDKNLEYRLITKYSTETYDLFKRMLKNYSN